MSLQTNQAHRMSYFLPHDALKRFYVSLIVLNCCSTPLILHLYKRDEAKKRFICLLYDCALDLAAAVVTPCAIIATYIGDFDMNLQGFPMEFWYKDIWYVNALHEFQILFVVSWRDLATRMVFSVGMLVAMSDMKDLPGTRHMSVNQVTIMGLINPKAKIPAAKTAKDIPVVSASVINGSLPAAVLARTLSSRISSTRQVSMQRRLRTASLVVKNPTSQRRFARFVRTFIVLWGAVVLGLHLHAESIPALHQCLVQVRPWGKVEAVRALVLINCYESEINGAKEDVDAQLNCFDPYMVVQILFRHCPALEMPPIVQKFSQMTILKVYNSSITEWSADAALTGTSHPKLEALLIARVNMTNGELPPGLLSPEFPPVLVDIEMSTTNLRTLPDDLNTKWPPDAQLKLEHNAFTPIPDVVMRLLPILVSFCGNPIEEIPAELFAVESIRYLHLGDNERLTALPANAALSTPLGQFYLQNTQIAFFPSWLDPVVDSTLSQGRQLIRAFGVPYCEYARPVFDRSLSDADAMAAMRAKPKTAPMLGPGEPSILMDTAEATRRVILGAVACQAETEWTYFPLDTEDEQSALR